MNGAVSSGEAYLAKAEDPDENEATETATARAYFCDEAGKDLTPGDGKDPMALFQGDTIFACFEPTSDSDALIDGIFSLTLEGANDSGGAASQNLITAGTPIDLSLIHI